MTLSKEGAQDSFPLQQKILVCSLLLLIRQLKIKEVTLGKVSGESQQMELEWMRMLCRANIVQMAYYALTDRN